MVKLLEITFLVLAVAVAAVLLMAGISILAEQGVHIDVRSVMSW